MTEQRYWVALYVITAILCSRSVQAATPELEQHVAKYAEKSKAARTTELKDAEQGLKAAVRLPSGTAKNAKARKEAIAQAKTRIADLKDPKKPFFPKMDLLVAKVGDMGPVTTNEISVFQRISADEAIISVISTGIQQKWKTTSSGNQYSVKVPTRGEKLMYIKGIKLDDKVDGAGIKLSDQFCFVSGTKTYDTADGTNTIAVIEPLDVKPYLKLFEATGLEDRKARPSSTATTPAPGPRPEGSAGPPERGRRPRR